METRHYRRLWKGPEWGGGVTIKPELNIANYKKEKQSQLYPQNSARLPGANTDMHSLPWKRAVSGGTFEIQYRELQRKKINQNDIVTISFRFQTQDQDRTPYEATRKRKEKKRDERCRRIRGWILRKTTAVAMATRHFFLARSKNGIRSTPNGTTPQRAAFISQFSNWPPGTKKNQTKKNKQKKNKPTKEKQRLNRTHRNEWNEMERNGME